MTQIKGIPVVIVSRVENGKDPFGAPIYEETEEVVENVLVAPATTDDIVTTQDLTGKKAVYTLAIPKGDMHNWEDTVVKFFGKEWHTFGYPLEGMEENIPLAWNKKVMVEKYG